MNGLLRDDRGIAIIWLLLFLPLLLSSVIYISTQTQAVTATDVDLRGALEVAAKSAAMQVTADSQAAGDPRVGAANAHAAFRRSLAQNLGLNQTTLAPLSGSMLKAAPSYVLVVYNGDGTYSAGGALAGYKYAFNGMTVTETTFAGTGFPKGFAVSAADIVPGGVGGTQVSLDRPGVIAVASTQMQLIMGNESLYPVRWAAAKIVKY